MVVAWTGLRQLSVGSLSVGEVDAALQSTEPGLLQLLRVGLQSTTPGNKHTCSINAISHDPAGVKTPCSLSYFWTESSSKQKRRST